MKRTITTFSTYMVESFRIIEMTKALMMQMTACGGNQDWCNQHVASYKRCGTVPSLIMYQSIITYLSRPKRKLLYEISLALPTLLDFLTVR